MRAIDDLAAALARFNAEALVRLDNSAACPMAKVAEDVSRRLSPRRALAGSPSFDERQLEALRRFRERGDAPDFRTLRLVCRGCTHYIADDRFVLLADSARLDALLGAAERQGQEPRRFRRLFDALRHAYLGVDRGDRDAHWFNREDAGQGNERLRQFLEGRFARVLQPEPAPEWVHTLASYPEILSSDPGRRFASDLLAGSWWGFDAACRGLGITGASWLAAETVRSAIEAAVEQEDHRTFVSHIPALLGVASEQRFASLRDEIFVALVTRYASVPGRPVHAPLRDTLVSAWKNPWLKQNDSHWGRVQEDVRKMVAGWLKLDVIRQFFEVLSDDRGQDRSRFEFWSQYHEQMDDVYIALGSSAYYSSSPDLVRLRQALEGRLLKLKHHLPDINAFIMFMGNDVVVEFSQRSNAAYCYELRHAPVGPYDRVVTIPQLKRRDTGDRMIHGRAGGLAWQEHFARDLKLDSKVQPPVHHRAPPRFEMRNVATQNSARQAGHLRNLAPHGSRQTAPNNQRAPSQTQDIHAFLRKHNLNWRDNRPKGGNLTIFTGMDHSDIVRQLTHWGFAYSQKGRFWWRTT